MNPWEGGEGQVEAEPDVRPSASGSDGLSRPGASGQSPADRLLRDPSYIC